MNVNEAIQSALKNYQAGNLQQAENISKKILIVEPKNIAAINLLGIIYYQLKNCDLAIQYMKKVISINSNNAQAYYIIGHSMQEKGEIDEAIIHYQKTLSINPNFADAYYNLGTIYQDKKQDDEAISFYQKAVQVNPTDVDAYYNLGFVLQEKGQHEEALPFFWKALQLNPSLDEAYGRIGLALQEKEQFDDAINAYQKSLALNPSNVLAYYGLATIFKEKGQVNDAINAYSKSLQLLPSNTFVYFNFLFTINYSSQYTSQDIFSEHLKFAKLYAEPISSSVTPYTNKRIPIRRLKIGYVSPDFRKHAVSYFIEPILVAHKREHFEVFCYSNSLEHDEVTKRIQVYSDQWHNIVGMSDDEVAGLIRRDEIDILVDLAGYTANNRILLFARKPAPIQISWIGYLATTGLSTMDYKIVDNYTDPIGKTEQFHTEKLMRLPESFLCYLPDKDSPEVGPLPALSTGHITFGSFNNFAKVTSEVFGLWAKILMELPESRLLLKGKSFHDTATCHYAINMFTQRGIAAERITLQSWDQSPKHLEAYNLVDIGLDTFPFNGATTTCEAMWMGVPVITLAGTAYHSRVGVSLLSNVGLPELVAKTPDEYVELAVSLATDSDKLSILRANLRDRMAHSPLTDAKRFTTNLEKYYREIWEIWCKSI
jgi:protein O-GlcNAc transferase